MRFRRRRWELPLFVDERGRVGDATVELQLLAAMLQSAARELRRGDTRDRAFAGRIATRLREVEARVGTVRLEVAAAPYVGASGADFIEHDGEIYVVGSPIKAWQLHPRARVVRHDETTYVLSLEFKPGNATGTDEQRIIARPVEYDTRAGASG